VNNFFYDPAGSNPKIGFFAESRTTGTGEIDTEAEAVNVSICDANT